MVEPFRMLLIPVSVSGSFASFCIFILKGNAIVNNILSKDLIKANILVQILFKSVKE